MNNFQNPAYVSRVNVDEVERELLRVRDTIGDTFVLPDWAGRYITMAGERKDLTAEEYAPYAARMLGQICYVLIPEAMGLFAWWGMNKQRGGRVWCI